MTPQNQEEKTSRLKIGIVVARHIKSEASNMDKLTIKLIHSHCAGPYAEVKFDGVEYTVGIHLSELDHAQFVMPPLRKAPEISENVTCVTTTPLEDSFESGIDRTDEEKKMSPENQNPDDKASKSIKEKDRVIVIRYLRSVTAKEYLGKVGTVTQGYFVYDSKKSGSQTVSHLRFGPEPIRAPYLVQQASFVGCHQFGLLDRLDVLGRAAPGATLLLNCTQPAPEVVRAAPAVPGEDPGQAARGVRDRRGDDRP